MIKKTRLLFIDCERSIWERKAKKGVTRRRCDNGTSEQKRCCRNARNGRAALFAHGFSSRFARYAPAGSTMIAKRRQETNDNDCSSEELE